MRGKKEITPGIAVDRRLRHKVAALVPRLLRWFAVHARDLPWRRTRDPYDVWVSEIMLQQTQVKTVIPYWERWMRTLPTVTALARAGEAQIHKLWEGLGYYSRVRNLQKAARLLVAEHDGKVPRDFDAVLALPGIGRYTAGAICSIAFNQPTPVLDGNVIRVLTRLFAIGADPRERATNARLWQLADALVTEAKRISEKSKSKSRRPRNCSHLNQSLMELGALVCTPAKPRCAECPVAGLCAAFLAKRVAEFPRPKRRLPPTARLVRAFVVSSRGRFLVRQRPPGGVNAGLWEFPSAEVADAAQLPAATAKELLGFVPRDLRNLVVIRHAITRHRITLEVFRGELAGGRELRLAGARWRTRRQLEALAFSSAHRRIARRLVAAAV